MIGASDIFLNGIAWIVHATLLSATLLITWRRVRRSARAATFGWLVLSFFATLVALAISTGVIGLVLYCSVIMAGPTLLRGSPEEAFLFVILGPALCGLLALAISIYPASLLSRLFWPVRSSEKDVVPPDGQ
jgi:hypothetical protein